MSQSITSRREDTIFQVAGYVIIGVAAIVGMNSAPSTAIRWITAVLLLVIALLQTFWGREVGPLWRRHLYLGVQGLLVAVLLFLQPGWTMFPVLYFPLSVQAVLMLSPRLGAYWIVAYTLAVGVSFVLTQNWSEVLMGLLIYGGANTFFGAYANALLRADTAHRESQALLEELQVAHHQLQEYARRVEEMAVVEERNRLAREMHDTLGHRLTVASVQLEGAQRLCPTDPQKAEAMVGTVRQQVREALHELRGTVATLRAPVETDLQLHSSLNRLAAHFAQATGLTVHQALPDEMPALPATHRLALYRAAQEALTNVQKHAGASQVWLVLTTGDDAITLLVGDDGHGLTMSAGQPGFGLQGLRERAAQLDGELHLEPRRGGGTQLSLRLPLPAGEENSASGGESHD